MLEGLRKGLKVAREARPRKSFVLSKTGLPFHDAQRLYGLVEALFGLSRVEIEDLGSAWRLTGPLRRNCQEEVLELLEGDPLLEEFKGIDLRDAALKQGIRDQISSYTALASQGGSQPKLPKFDKTLVNLSAKRITPADRNFTFYLLPVFRGPVNFSRVLKPLDERLPGNLDPLWYLAYLGLSLRLNFFSEGEDQHLEALVYTTNIRQQLNRSGYLYLPHTLILKLSLPLARNLRNALRGALAKVNPQGRSDPRAESFLREVSLWLLTGEWSFFKGLIGTLEGLYAFQRERPFWGNSYQNAEEVFRMSAAPNEFLESHLEDLRRFARALSSAIWHTAMKEKVRPEEKYKAWYDRVATLRSAGSPRAFLSQAVSLLEKAKGLRGDLCTSAREEDFDPERICRLFENLDSRAFEKVLLLIRMYLLTHEPTKRGEV